jgi:uracil phosphoribosyltransferase
MKNLRIIDHPLVKRDLTILRNVRTPSYVFRAVLRRMAALMAYEVTKDLSLKKVVVRSPLEKTTGSIVEHPIVLVPILRAGLGLVGGFVEVFPEAKVGHIGLYRDESTLRPVDYYFKVPKKLDRALVLVLDPMLATGGSGAEAITFLKKKGARNIRFVSLVSAPEGVRVVRNRHPEVIIYTCSLDRQLNSKGYILPGLGDAGDRLFGTE